MSDIATKLTYLNTTKGKIKDSINLTGANILSTDTFRSYATKLKNGLVDIINNGINALYDNFPKVVGEGTEIVLNNTYEAPIKLNVVKGDTTQEGTPTPDTPQEVKAVTGLQNVEVIGKNLLPNINKSDTTSAGITFTYNSENGTYTANGTNNGQNNSVVYLFNDSQVPSLTLPAGTYYTAPFDISAVSLTLRSTSGTYYDFDLNHTSITLTQETSFTHCYLQARKTTSPTLNNYVYYPILSTTPVTVETYQPYSKTNYEVDLGTLELCKIGDYQDFIKKSTGKNLIDNSQFVAGSGATIDNNNTNSITATFVNTYKAVNLYKNVENKNYTFSVGNITNSSARIEFYLYKNNEQVNKVNVNANNTYSFDNTNGICDQVRITLSNGNLSGTNQIVFYHLQLEEGTTATEYEPYGKVWYKKANIGKKTVTESEIVAQNDTYTNVRYYKFNKATDDIDYNKYNGANIYYTNGIVNNGYDYDNANMIGKILPTPENIRYWVGFTKDITLSQAKEKITGSVLYYILATPTYEVITNDTLINQLESIKSKEGTTNITISGNLPMIVNASALKKE